MVSRAWTCSDSSASFILNHHKFAFGISLMTEQEVSDRFECRLVIVAHARSHGLSFTPFAPWCGGVRLFAPISTRSAQLLVGGCRIRCVCRADNGARAPLIPHFCIIFAVDYNLAGNRAAEKIKRGLPRIER